MSKKRIFVVEDMAMNRLMIEAIIENHGFAVAGTSTNAKAALALIKETKPDLVLLDIKLKGEETGIWLGEKIHQELKIPFVYITAYHDSNTVSELLQTAPMGFIAKPIHEAQLIATINIALNVRTPSKGIVITINDGSKLLKLEIDDILYFHSESNYVHIFMKSSHLLIRNSISKIEEVLPSERFVRIHLRTIVNMQAPMQISSNQLIINGRVLQISGSYKHDFLSKIQRSV